MPLMELHLPVHAKAMDGFPVCCDPDDVGEIFEGTWDEWEVTCKKCLTYMKED